MNGSDRTTRTSLLRLPSFTPPPIFLNNSFPSTNAVLPSFPEYFFPEHRLGEPVLPSLPFSGRKGGWTARQAARQPGRQAGLRPVYLAVSRSRPPRFFFFSRASTLFPKSRKSSSKADDEIESGIGPPFVWRWMCGLGRQVCRKRSPFQGAFMTPLRQSSCRALLPDNPARHFVTNISVARACFGQQVC